MEAISWSDRLATGIKDIDDQHKTFIGLVNRLQAAVASKGGDHLVPQLVGELREHAKLHFDAEEEVMKRLGYPGLSAHRLEHLNLTNRVKLIQQSLYKKQTVSGAALMKFLRDWLLGHILKMDMEYVRFVRSKPAQVTVGAEAVQKKAKEA